jgi:hypothetical protein
MPGQFEDRLGRVVCQQEKLRVWMMLDVEEGVIPKARAFTSGARDLARISTGVGLSVT